MVAPHRTPTGSTTVQDIVTALETAYPPHLAEPWDHPGLICGDPESIVEKVCLTVDLTPRTLAASLNAGATIIVTHHPVLFQPVHTIATTTPQGKLLHTAITAGCAVMCAHTNADSANPGVSDALAEALEITVTGPIAPHEPAALDRWIVHVPPEYRPTVLDAVFAAGAGHIGDYDQCAFHVEGTGQFRPSNSATPFLGRPGILETVTESRIEFVALRRLRREVEDQLLRAHPYQQPSYDIIEIHSHMSQCSDPHAPGLGRRGVLSQPLTLKDLTDKVAKALPATVWGVRAAGNPETEIRTVAVCGGSGGSLLDDVLRLGVDCFITSDLRHHSVEEYLQAGGKAVIDTAHAASEYPWLAHCAQLLHDATGVVTEVLTELTDPWTVHCSSQH